MSIIKNNEELDFLEENNLSSNRELVFGYLSIDILKDNIENQIDSIELGIINTKINYINLFKSKYDYVMNIINSDDMELIDNLNQLRYEFYEFIFNKVMKKFSIKIKLPFILSNEEKFELIEDFYKYFVININETISNFIINDIIENEKNIIRSMKSTVNKKEIYFNLIKKDLGLDYATIVNSVDNYIDIMEIDDIEDLIENSYCVKDNAPESYRENIKELFIDEDNSVLDINFNKNNFLDLIKEITNNEPTIILDVRNKVYNYYLHKKNNDK